MAYGEAGAAAACQDFSMLVIWICEHKLPEFEGKDNRMTVHVDDFLIVAHSATECNILAAAFDRLCAELGIKISVEKNEDAIQRGVVHGFGFKLDTPVKTVYIPSDKASDLIFGCLVLLETKLATGEALEALSGKIMHWSRLKRRAKVFCNHGIRRLHQHVRKLPKHKKQYVLFTVGRTWLADIALFLRFFLLFREVPMASILYEPSITITASTDASSTGGAFICADKWYGYDFAKSANRHGRVHADMHINMQEAHAVIMMIHHCRSMLSGRKLLLWVDNQVCMYGIIKAWSASRALMDFVQEISMLTMHYCIDLRVEYIPTELNTFSDLLSRGARSEFLELIDLYDFDMQEQVEVDYYDHLRIMHSPLQLPAWLKALDCSLALESAPIHAPPELYKLFSAGFEEK